MRFRLAPRVLIVASAILISSSTFAAWRTQTIQMKPGWNAVCLEVQPEPSRCDMLLSGLPVEGVWKWNRSFRSEQFETDPNLLLPGDPHWMIWMPTNSGHVFLNTLFEMSVGEAYLIKVATNASAFDWSFKGQTALWAPEWYPYALNLVGLPVNPVSSMVFSEYFKHTKEVDALPNATVRIYSIDSNGRSVSLGRRTSLVKIQPGTAYWIAAKNPGTYAGPLLVSAAGGPQLDYGLRTREQDVTISNVSTTEAFAVTVRPSASESAPPGQPEVAGEVPLAYYYVNNVASNDYGWSNLVSAGLSRTLAAGQSWTLKLAVRRGDMGSYHVTGTNGALWQSVLDVADAGGQLLYRLPVSAENPDKLTGVLPPGVLGSGDTPDVHPNQGLWVGDVSLDQVNAPYFSGTNTLPVTAPFTMRLIVHVDGTGQARLLQHVLMALVQTDPDTSEYQLFSSLDPNLPNDVQEVNRISSAAFPVMDPVLMSGGMGDQQTLSALVTVNYDDPTNPFLHRYHPLHDNEDANWVAYDGPVETYTIARNISLLFQAQTNDATANAIFGMDTAIGVYQETITGVRRDPVVVRGQFQLRRASLEQDLN